MQLAEVSVFGVRTSVTVFRHQHCSLRFVLMPVFHFGRPDYYRGLAERLARCRIVVAEGIDAPSPLGLAYVIALRVTGQRRGGPLVHQNIDYAALDVPVIWPDGLPLHGRRKRIGWWGWLDLALFVPWQVFVMAVGGRDWLARRMIDVTDLSEHRDTLRNRMILDDRDRQLIAALRRLHERHEGTEPVDVGVIYGASHFTAVVRALAGELRYRPGRDAEWLTAIDF